MRNRARWRTLRRAACPVLWTLTLLAPSLPAWAAKAAGLPEPRVFELRGAGQPLWRRWIDLDGDGRLDLIVVSGSASGAAADEEVRVETLVAYLQVTPFFLDRRQVLIYRQTADGFAPWGDPLPLTGDTAAVDVADLDGDGRPEVLFAAGYRLFAFERKSDGDAAYGTTPRPLGDVEMLLGYTRSFVPGARLTATLSAGKPPALLLTTPTGLEARRLAPDGALGASPEFVLRSGFRTIGTSGNGIFVFEPHPRILDADGDGTFDILFQRGADALVYHGAGDGTFAKRPLEVDLGERGQRRRGGGGGGGGGFGFLSSPEFQDLDGDGLLDIVRMESVDDDEDEAQPDFSQVEEAADKAGTKESEAGQGTEATAEPDAGTEAPPVSTPDTKADRQDKDASKSKDRKKQVDSKTVASISVRHGRSGFTFPETPDLTLAIDRTEKRQGAGISTLKIDAGPRVDLVVTRFAVSLWQVARFLVTKKIAVRMSFESMLQRPDGTFAPSRGKPFESKLTIDLKRGISGVPTAPRGDFNGDGITDLPEFTGSPELRVHLTTREGVFPEDAAWTVKLPREPEDRVLMDIEDLDGDGRSDVAYFNPEKSGFVATIVRSR